MEGEKTCESACEEKETMESQRVLSPDLSAGAGDNERAGSKEPNAAGSEPPPQAPEQHPEDNLESGSEAAGPSQSLGEPEKVDVTESECEGPESKQRKVDFAEKTETSSQLKDLDFLVPKTGFFCQICSCFCVDEASMKAHCQLEVHKQNMEKFVVKSATQEEQKGVKKGAEEQSSV
ncbi:hypothetical protein JRQ81_016347 [Phrynocephalus forsythii]|uniref:Matrin-type domain-containing protein n=1 Tax=Phrynocephalus forsythii TaxID=171643 RepID=A0A9Q1B0T9_9SAUR|nr:hypothetical protein JRQ81_016347 [Phrynocephalus forsythii]